MTETERIERLESIVRALYQQVAELRAEVGALRGGAPGASPARPAGMEQVEQRVEPTPASLAPSACLLDGDVLLPAPGLSWPPTAARPGAVRLRYRAGYPPAANTNATHAVPPPILQAMLIIVALLYENRLGDVNLAENRAVAALLAPFRRWGSA